MLKKFTVHVRVLDLNQTGGPSQVFALPVDSPDEEHAISAAMSNAIAFTTKTEKGQPLPLAFTCERIEERS